MKEGRDDGVLVIGEPLAELRPAADGSLAVDYSGDALNVAVRLARGGRSVALATAVGADRFSGELLERMSGEAVSDRWVQRTPDGVLGIYLVELDGAERRFTYWRSTSAASRLVDAVGPDRLRAAAVESEVVVLSGITLAILDEDQRRTLVELLSDACRSGTRVVFDPNVRLLVWGSLRDAQRWTGELVRLASVVLASTEDLELLGVSTDGLSGQVDELVVTAGADPTRWWCDGASGAIDVPPVEAVDTTGAGDAFDAAYLLARLGGADVPGSVVAGHAAAAAAVRHRGGLLWDAAGSRGTGPSGVGARSTDSARTT